MSSPAAYSSSFSVWWPYDPNHVIIKAKPPKSLTLMVVMNPIYKDHLQQLLNWTVRENFRQSFPALEDLIDQDSDRTQTFPSFQAF
jgi:hypothetical protein